MFRKLMIVALVCLVCSGLAFAAGSKEAAATQGAQEGNVTGAGIFPVVKQPWTMTVMAPQDPLVEDFDTNKFTLYMEKKTGIHVNWQLIPANNPMEKINLVLAAGADLPDVILGAYMSNDALVQYGSQGILLPLNSYIDKLSTEFKRVLQLPNFKTFRSQLTAPDGNIYSLPKISECYQCEYAQRLYVNQDWLNVLGLKMPTTTEEFYQVLKAFKTRDPNGNGKADEVPFTGAITGWHTEIDAQIMNSFIYNDGRKQNRMIVKNGKVDVVFDKPQWRDGLRYMARLAKEGLLDPAAFTQDINQMKQLVGNTNTMQVGVATGGAILTFMSPNSPNAQKYAVIPPLAGPNGVKGTGYFPTSPQAGVFVITNASENPAAAFRWADWMYSEEASLFTRFGEEGTDWVRAKPGEVDPMGNQAFLKPILLWGSVQNSHWTFDNPGYSSRRDQVSQVADPKVWDANNAFIAETPIYEKVAPSIDEVLPKLFFTSDEIDEVLDLKTSVIDYVEESIARFTLGYLDIEKDWNTYLSQLDALGLKRLIALTQTAYDRQTGGK